MAHIASIMALISIISGSQMRAARALLGMSAAQLADAAGIGHRTVQRFGAEDGIPDGRTAILMQIIRTFEERGITFLGDPIHSPGVQFHRQDVGLKETE